jgi:hypothetical protein
MDALKFLEHVWSQQGEGFAFISFRSSPTSWRDVAFKFPGDKIELPDPTLGDVYFCPNLFSRPRRRKGLVLPSCWLYADLDGVKPPTVDDPLMRKRKTNNNPVLEPTIAWESSPGRYQALWHIDKYLSGEAHSRVNQKLTYALGADKGGWDITQVLRVPGTRNHKYDGKPEVKLLWA